MKTMKYSILAITTTALLAMPALAEDPAKKSDGTWISVSGTVKSVSPDTFVPLHDKSRRVNGDTPHFPFLNPRQQKYDNHN